jgi:GNAT superfamily N-acetyltransferase
MIELPRSFRRESTAGLIVRESHPEDLEAVLRLLSQMHDDEPPIDADESARSTFANIAECSWRRILVAEHEGVIVGTLDLFVLENLTRGLRPWAGVENVVVDSRVRGRGFGASLLDAGIGLAREAGCYKIQLVSHAKRSAAHALYQHHGFDAPVHGYRRYLDS